jgi:glycosyltransferase involved in cell wall biosynthesis
MINLFAPTNNLGYGVHSSNLIKTLVENGQELTLSSIGEIQLDPFYEMYFKEATKNSDKFNVKNPSVFIFHDELSNQACGTPLFTYSIFETSKVKPSSFNMLENGPTNVILTTTSAHKQNLLDQGISKPIEVVGEGVDETLYNTIPINKYIDTKKLTYIIVGKREERKNTDIGIKVFINLMKDKEVSLICHTFNPFINRTQDHPFKNLSCWSGVNPLKHGFEYKGFDGKAHLFTYQKCDLYFTTPTIPTSNMPSLYHSANIGIQISRGEGWDLPLQEMMACGIPCIATNCLGHNEYLTNEIPEIQKTLVINNTEMTVAIDNMWFKGNQGVWEVLNIEKFSQLLEETHKDSTKYEQKNDQLSNYITTNYSWSIAAKKLITVIEKYKGIYD